MADKTIRLGVDGSEAQNFQSQMRQSSEQLARDMIRSARSYSTSSKEVLKDIEEQIRAIEKRNKLDQEFRRTQLESARSSGRISQNQYTESRSQFVRESKEDILQTKLLREIVDAIKHTSKEEIREDRKNVEQTLIRSKGVNKLGVEGDEFEALKRTFQQGILGDVKTEEVRQRSGFNLRGAVGIGSQIAQGDTGGAMMGGGMSLAKGAFSNPYTAVAAVALLAAGGTLLANKAMGENLRGYGLSTQQTLPEMAAFRKSLDGAGFTRYGMTGNELLTSSIGYNRALGGADLSGKQLTGLTAITKSRDVSEDLLGQTLGFSRYSNSGGLTTVIKNLEDSIRKMYGGDDFKRKLVQLPEMMQVYNSLAAQMLSTTGSVNQGALSAFVGGVGGNFGVEGQNLQRYSSGLTKMFGKTNNRLVGSIQADIIRKKFPHLSGGALYQKMLEVQEDPTSNQWFMEEMWGRMQQFGGSGGSTPSPEFRSWAQQSGFGAKEIREKMWGKNIGFSGYNSNAKTDDAKNFESFIKDASQFYSAAEELDAKKKDLLEDIKLFFGKILEGDSVKVTVTGNTANNVARLGQTPNQLLPSPKF